MKICFPKEILLVVGSHGSFIPKKPVIVSHETSVNELPLHFNLFFFFSHIRWLPCDEVEQRKPLEMIYFFLFCFFVFEVVRKWAAG